MVNRLKQLIVFLIFFIGITMVSSEEAKKNISVCEFYKNPFEKIDKIPDICDSLDRINEYIGKFDISSEDVSNKYVDGIIDKKVYLSNNDFYIYYLYSGYKKKYLLQLISISSNKNGLKYGIKVGMKKSEIIDIFGYSYTSNNFENNYEIVYEDKIPCSGAVQFLFNYDDVLDAINLWNIL